MDSLCMPYILLSVHDRELEDLAEQIQPNCVHLLRQGHRFPYAELSANFINLWLPSICQRDRGEGIIWYNSVSEQL